MPLPYTPLPTAPSRARPTTFADEGDAFMAALPTFGTQMEAFGNQTETLASQVDADATQVALDRIAVAADAVSAAASAASAVNSPGTNATSVTSTLIGTGSKSITVQTGKLFVVGQPVMIARTSAPGTTWMAGNVTAYTTGTGALVVNVVWTAGSGTFTDWTVSLAGPANPAALSKAGDTATGPIGIPEEPLLISTGITAVRFKTYVLTASLTLTLPASPVAGDWVRVVNRSGTRTAVVGRNAQNIMGLAENMTVDETDGSFRLVYADATRGWVLV